MMRKEAMSFKGRGEICSRIGKGEKENPQSTVCAVHMLLDGWPPSGA